MTQTIADLVRASAAGNRTAFEKLVSQTAAMVTGVAYSTCGDFALSEDIAQDAFIEGWKKLSSIHEPEKFPGWICTIARRRAIDAVRSAKSTGGECSLDSITYEIHDLKQLTPEAIMSLHQERELVWSMLARLPEAYREPMVLFYRCDESTRDVATALGESEANIRQRLKRARDMLRTEMADSIRNTLGATVPKPAFAIMVMATLPSSSYAAGAAATTATAGKASSAVGTAAASAIGGAVLGSLMGIAGGVWGTWMSWRNCEYVSQQRFILRQAMLFAAGLGVFGILLSMLVAARMQGFIAQDSVYVSLLVGLIAVSQCLNCAWIWRGIRGYNRFGKEAKLRGEPIRESVQRKLDTVREHTQVLHSDGSVTNEAFRWSGSGWFGSCAGSTAWMIPLAVVAFRHGSISVAILSCLCCLLLVALAFLVWQFREYINAYVAYQSLLLVVLGMTILVLAGIQFWGNEETQELVRWSPWVWCILIIFPVLSLQSWWIRRTFQQTMREHRASEEAKVSEGSSGASKQ